MICHVPLPVGHAQAMRFKATHAYRKPGCGGFFILDAPLAYSTESDRRFPANPSTFLASCTRTRAPAHSAVKPWLKANAIVRARRCPVVVRASAPESMNVDAGLFPCTSLHFPGRAIGAARSLIAGCFPQRARDISGPSDAHERARSAGVARGCPPAGPDRQLPHERGQACVPLN